MLIIKSFTEVLLYSQPFLLRAGKNFYAFVADTFVLAIGLPICMNLDGMIKKMFPGLNKKSEKQICIDNKRKTIRVSLDSQELFFLSVFYDEMGIAHKYSIDVEKAADSHYEIDAVEMKKLSDYFNRKLENSLKKYLKTYSEHDLVELLDKLHIQYTPFHYDCYD